MQRKFDAGQATSVDVGRWQAELAQEQAITEQLDGSLRVRHRQLAVLLGVSEAPPMPILDGGRIRANIAVQEARANEAMAEYEKAMLAALTDAEAALAQWSVSEASLSKWERAQSAGETAALRAERLFDAGLTDVSAVLDARRSYLRAQDAVSQAEGARWAAAVSLRRVFAGAV